MRAASALDGTSKGRAQRGRWIRAAPISYGDELSVRKKQNTYIEDIDRVATERYRLPFDAFGANIEWQRIERGDSISVTMMIVR